MNLPALAALALAAFLGLAPPPADAQPQPTAELLAAQRQALQPLAFLDGTWRGAATITQPDGSTLQLTQTERVGGFLGGSVKVIEGRGYAADGSLPFNAFAVLAFDATNKRWSFRAYAQGHFGDHLFVPRADGFDWEVKTGPAALVRYRATVKDGVWHEVGDLLIEGRPPRRILEMKLQRIGDSDWPAAGAVPPK
jgi:hypothetical protein